MRLVVQRVSEASVSIAGETVGAIATGLLVLVAVAPGDSDDAVEWLARKVSRLRIFPDEAGKMNRSVNDVGGSALIVSQFTLYGNCRKGNRPSFAASAEPAVAEACYERFVAAVRAEGVPVETGCFAADMAVALVNDGPVTLIIDSPS